MDSTPKPRRCLVTKIGLVAFALAAAAFVATFVWQWAATGSMDRDTGFRAPMWMRMAVLYGAPASLAILLAGALYDAARYSAWKKRGGQP